MRDTSQIDVSSLYAYQKVLSLWRHIGTVAGFAYFGLFIIFAILLNNPAIPEGSTTYNTLNSTFGISLFTVVAMGWFAGIRYYYLRGKHHLKVVREFISDNNWKAKRESPADKIPSILLGASTYRLQYYPFNGTYKGQRFSCTLYEFETKTSQTRRFICVNFKLPKSYPMLIIDNRLNDKSWLLSTLPARLPNRAQLKLEGDFDSYYTTSTTKGSEHHAMHVLSPDIMAVLKDNAAHMVDIEIANKNLFLMYEADFFTEKNVESIFTVADAILREFKGLSRSWMESSKGEERVIAKTALAARNKLVYRPDYLAFIGMGLALVWTIGIMISSGMNG
ncbi:MAG TPA: hypothetical protein VLA88_05575 [Candidatus Saccharimonadales bacterium]|nr:hypothetical protein [Candidatus Saccharimonadales bacterium]